MSSVQQYKNTDLTAASELVLLSSRHTVQDIESWKPKSISQVFELQSPSLRSVLIHQGEGVLNSVFMILFSSVNEFYGEGAGLSGAQEEILAGLITDQYGHFKIADIKLCFNRGLASQYDEKQFSKISPKDIMNWLKKYEQERLEAAEQVSKMRHNSVKQEFKNPSINKQGIEQIIKAFDKVISKTEELKTETNFQTIEQYCKANELDYNSKITALKSEWKIQFETSKNGLPYTEQDYYRYKSRQLLVRLNKGECKL